MAGSHTVVNHNFWNVVCDKQSTH